MIGGNITAELQQFQSTLPRRERLASIYSLDRICEVSIHAPTKGATPERNDDRAVKDSFNPRSHEGSDPIAVPAVPATAVSIHAPTKGATLRRL